MIKGIFLDVDGTLYSHKIHDIPPSALSSMEVLQSRGIRFFLATGRHPLALSHLNLHNFPFDGYITLTGHLCYDREKQPVFLCPLPEFDTAVLRQAFRDHLLPMLLLHEDESYMNYVDDRTVKMMSSVSSAPPPVRPLSEKPVYSAAVYCQRQAAEQLSERLPGCRLSAWHSTGFDIISRNMGKVRGIEEMMRRYHLKREEIAVFGDADNDVEMISFAGIGIAMGNGTPAAKAAADYVTDSVDADGLKKAFRHLGLLEG